MNEDPYQLINNFKTLPSSKIDILTNELYTLNQCVGDSCRP